jgi:hypothetical protein
MFAALGGFALSVAVVARPVTALASAVPFALLVFRERRGGGIRAMLGAATAAALPLAAWLAWVNHALTGNATQTAYGAFDRASNAVYGAVDLATAASISAFNLARLSVWTSGVAPGLVLPVLGAAFAPRGARAWVAVAMPVSLFAFYALHPFHGIPWVGPVYLSDAAPALALLTAQGWFVIERAFGSRLRNALIALSIAGCALLLASHFELARDEIDLRQRPYAAARAAGLQHGIVFVRIESHRARRLYPLHPPGTRDTLVFARDLGARNAELIAALNHPPAWIYDPESDELKPL